MNAPTANDEVTLLKQEVVALRAQIDWLKRQLFGPGKSETLDRLQAALALGEAAVAVAPAKTETIRYERTVASKEKRPLPAETFKDLPVAETIEIIPDEVKAAPDLFEKISEERTFEVDIIAPQLVKRVIIRPKYRHKLNRALPPVIAPALVRPGGGWLCLGRLARLDRALQVRGPPAALSFGKDVAALGCDALAADHGRLDHDHRRLARTDLQDDASAPAHRQLSASR
jgi:hypothetical protein